MARSEQRIARWASAAAPMLRLPQRRSAEGTAPHPEGAPTPSRLGGALDFVSDWGVLAFAVWTLIAYGGMATQANATLLVSVWVATVPLLGALLVGLSRRRSDSPPPVRAPRAAETAPRYGRHLAVAAVAAGLASALLVAAAPGAPWALVWVGALVAVAFALARGRLRSEGPAPPEPAVGWPAHAFAALVGLVFAGMSLFITRPDGDDPFYVNRAVGTAELNRIPVRDIIFTHERVDAIGGTGLPIDSFSALQGALARLIGIEAASFAYYVTPPLMTFFATWALWRLLRAWSPRNLVLCFAVGCAYWLFSAETRLAHGSFFLTRMWQGKVIFVSWLVLTAYVLLTRWLSRRDALTALLLLAAGLSSIGMTGSAAFIAPVVFGTAAAALLAARDWRGLPIVLAAAAIPALVGLAVTLKYPLVEILPLSGGGGGTDRGSFGAIETEWYFYRVFPAGALAALGLIGLCAAPWLARSGSPARMTSGIAVVSIVLLAPAVLPAINHVTDLGVVLRRIFWAVPLPALVGLLGAVPLVRLLRPLARAPTLLRASAAVAPAILTAGLLAAFGHPLWISLKEKPLWVSHPTWKTHQAPLADARAILGRYSGSGPILADNGIMRAISLLTVDPKAVSARNFYARYLPAPARLIRDRLALSRFVEGEKPTPSRREVDAALLRLGVGLVCVEGSRQGLIRDVTAMGSYDRAFRANEHVCFERRR
jgi:hypothetical protein